MQDMLDLALRDAAHEADNVQEPRLVKKRYGEMKSERDQDQSAMASAVRKRVSNIDLPVICFLGAYGSGKTFLQKHLLGTTFLESNVARTTAKLTVLRHIKYLPKGWTQTSRVFALAAGSDPRSLDVNAIVEEGGYEDLRRMTTYEGNHDAYDTVVVFLESEFLLNKIAIDCPGTGVSEEAEDALSREQEAKNKIIFKEQELQRLAMEASDAFVFLSSMTGGQNAFDDASTQRLLAEIARHVNRFPSLEKHANVLLVGSQADPTRSGLADTDVAKALIRKNVLSQYEKLPAEAKENIDPNWLLPRVSLFYALDDNQRDRLVADKEETIRSVMKNMSEADIRKAIEESLKSSLGPQERTKETVAAIEAMSSSASLQMDVFREQVAKKELTTSIDLFRRKRASAVALAESQGEMEALSQKYNVEQADREAAWAELRARAFGVLSTAHKRTKQKFDQAYALVCSRSHMEKFLDDRYTNRKQAKEYAAGAIQDYLRDELQEAAIHQLNNVDREVRALLGDFDVRYLSSATSGDFLSNGLSSEEGASELEVDLQRIQTVSALGTFKAVTAGVAGGTTVLAVAGSPLALAALSQAVAITVGAAGAVGMGGAVSGLLFGIPVYGWLAAGIAGIGYAVYRWFTPWYRSMAKQIVKSADREKSSASRSASTGIERIFDAAKDVLEDALDQTSEVMDGHIQEVHDYTLGAVTSEDYRQAAGFYHSHEKLLRATLVRIAAD